MPTQMQRPLRSDSQALRAWLDRLDRRTVAAALEARAAPRFPYRSLDASLELHSGDEPGPMQQVATRNLSRTGAGLLAGQFVYPRSACRLTLTGPDRRPQTFAGRVVRCRYLVGSGSLYELGVEFDRPIDATLFAPHARLLRVLAVGTAAETCELIRRFVAGLHVQVVGAAEGTAAPQELWEGEFDLVLVELETTAFDPFAIVQQIRAGGFVGPVIGLAVRTGPELHARCLASGCTGYILKPLVREDLHRLVSALRDPPLVSALADEPGMAPLINQFVAGLRDRVTGLSLASETGDWAAVEHIVRDLQAEAGSYGFVEITEEAAYVQALLAAERAEGGAAAPRAADIGPALRQLMHLCLKARPAASGCEG
ncbi:MAG: response regulator, partial [Planctomycetota bacterium]